MTQEVINSLPELPKYLNLREEFDKLKLEISRPNPIFGLIGFIIGSVLFTLISAFFILAIPEKGAVAIGAAGIFIILTLGFYSIYSWALIGREVVHFSKEKLTIYSKNHVFRKPKTVKYSDVSDVWIMEDRAENGKGPKNPWMPWETAGTIKMNVKGEVVRFGGMLSKEDAKALLQILSKKGFLVDQTFFGDIAV